MWADVLLCVGLLWTDSWQFVLQTLLTMTCVRLVRLSPCCRPCRRSLTACLPMTWVLLQVRLTRCEWSSMMLVCVVSVLSSWNLSVERFVVCLLTCILRCLGLSVSVGLGMGVPLVWCSVVCIWVTILCGSKGPATQLLVLRLRLVTWLGLLMCVASTSIGIGECVWTLW